MSQILTDRSTRFDLVPGAAIEVRIMNPETQVWSVQMEEHANPFGGYNAVLEVRLVVSR